MIKQAPTLDELEDIKEMQQAIANRWGCLVTVTWEKLHLAFNPKKEHEHQLVLDGMDFPKRTEFLGEGE